MLVNLSYLEVPMEEKTINSRLKDSMYLTALPLFKNIDIEWEKLHLMFCSDFRQITPFEYKENTKKSENWSNTKQNLIIFDIDNELSISKAKDMFKDFKYFIYTTKNHQKDKKGIICDRFRIVFYSENIPNGDDYFLFTKGLEEFYPFIDKQVNNKTGAFLGSSNAIYFYNEGKKFDCNIYLSIAKSKASKNETLKQYKHIENRSYEDDLELDKIKNLLNRETVADIINNLGFEVDRNFKFKYRKEERSPSASIHQGINPLIKDFGSDLSTDIIGFIQIVKGCSFKEAINYLRGFLNV